MYRTKIYEAINEWILEIRSTFSWTRPAERLIFERLLAWVHTAARILTKHSQFYSLGDEIESKIRLPVDNFIFPPLRAISGSVKRRIQQEEDLSILAHQPPNTQLTEPCANLFDVNTLVALSTILAPVVATMAAILTNVIAATALPNTTATTAPLPASAKEPPLNVKPKTPKKKQPTPKKTAPPPIQARLVPLACRKLAPSSPTSTSAVKRPRTS